MIWPIVLAASSVSKDKVSSYVSADGWRLVQMECGQRSSIWVRTIILSRLCCSAWNDSCGRWSFFSSSSRSHKQQFYFYSEMYCTTPATLQARLQGVHLIPALYVSQKAFVTCCLNTLRDLVISKFKIKMTYRSRVRTTTISYTKTQSHWCVNKHCQVTWITRFLCI